MGDISAEPSMEEILSSIKRIIAEEGDGQPRNRRQQRPIVPQHQIDDEDDIDDSAAPIHDAIHHRDANGGDDRNTGRGAEEPILELSDPMPEPERDTDRRPRAARPRAEASAEAGKVSRSSGTVAESSANGDSILSQETAAASRGSLATLSKLLVKPEQGSDGTVEGLIREMLRPMLREWLDANLPDLVETLVAREIEKITGQA